MEIFKELGRGDAKDHRLPNEDVKDLLNKYKGLSDDGEYFVIDTTKGKLYFHKWKDIEGKKIEEYIREHLRLSK